jgi:glutaredoxin
MHICDDGHSEVVYTVDECPVCKATKELAAVEKRESKKEEQIYELEGTIADLSFKLEECQNA